MKILLLKTSFRAKWWKFFTWNFLLVLLVYILRILYFLEFFPRVLLISECGSMWVQFKGRNNTRAGTQHFHARIRTALLADSARTNMKFAHDRDKSTWFSCTMHLNDCKYWFQQVSLHVEVHLNSGHWATPITIIVQALWCGDYSRAWFISFSSSQMTGAEQFKGEKNSGKYSIWHTFDMKENIAIRKFLTQIFCKQN